jgi:hypothetical protein
MSADDERLTEVVVRVVACRRGAAKVAYSREDGRTLWDGGDRVEHAEGAEQYGFYVTLHHFGGEAAGIIGQHVALAPADIVRFSGGEEHRYRLRRGRGAGEHLSVYVYNPSVCANGPLRFEVSTTDAVQSTGPFCVSVEEDTCPAVVKFGRASMQADHRTVLRRLEHEYQVVLRIEFVGEAERVPRGCLQCCDLRLDVLGGPRRAGLGRGSRRWHCTHCFELRHWV